MSIAITDDHRALAKTVSDFLSKNGARSAARALLEAPTEPRPAFWADMGKLGWLGLHLPEKYGGSGYGLPELVVVVEELGRAVAPGPFVPTVIASAVIAAAGSPEQQERLLPGLASGSLVGGLALGGDVTVRDGTAHGQAGPVLGGGLADVLILASGDDVLVVETAGGGVTAEVPANLDPTRRSARVTLDGAPAAVVAGRPAGPRRPGPVDPGRRGVRRRPRVHRAGERVRQGARAVRPPDRHLPGGEAPLRQHAGGGRTGHGGRLGRRPRRRRRRRPVQLHGGDGRDPGRAGRDPERAAQHPGARRHRLHLGARRPPVPAPGRGHRGDHRRRGGGRRRDRPGAAGRPPGRRDRPAARGGAGPAGGPAGRRAPPRPERRREQSRR